MYAAYHLNMDELNADVIQGLKNTLRQREIVILPKDTYDEPERRRPGASFGVRHFVYAGKPSYGRQPPKGRQMFHFPFQRDDDLFD